jgi:apolipoprotein N-acyltransferase
VAICWTVYEFFKSVNFLGYPWGLVGYPVGDFLPLIQFVDTTGIWGLSFLMALANALVAEGALAFLSPRDALGTSPRVPFFRQLLFALVLFACALSYGFLRLARPIAYETKASLLLVQQNMDPWDMGKASDESLRVNLRLTLEGVRAGGPLPDLAVWSESSVSNILVEESGRLIPAGNALVPGVQQAGVPVLFGGIVVKDLAAQQFMNAAILVSPEGKVLDTYGKMHPVPFAESIPFLDNPVVLAFFKNVVGIWNPWVMGDRYTVFRVPLKAGGTLGFGVPICFEDAFSSLCREFFTRGADILVNVTNDSWSKTWSSEIQHFAVARFRAVENRRILVRSANGGVTAVVGPWGEIRERLPFFERMARNIDFPVYREKRLSPYTRFGDWFPRALIIVLLVILDLSILEISTGRPLRELRREKRK